MVSLGNLTKYGVSEKHQLCLTIKLTLGTQEKKMLVCSHVINCSLTTTVSEDLRVMQSITCLEFLSLEFCKGKDAEQYLPPDISVTHVVAYRDFLVLLTAVV